MNELLVNDLMLRKATLDDMEKIFVWRNSSDTRKYFFDPREISFKDHQDWFHGSLQNNNRFLLIGEMQSYPIGVLRYDLYGNEAEIDIYLVPGLYGKGIGTRLLAAGNKWLKVNVPGINKVIAKIMCDNGASKKAFKKAGFEEVYSYFQFHINNNN